MELSDQPHASAALTSGKNSSTHRVRRLGGPQCLSGRFEEQKNVLPLPEFEPRTVQPVPVIMSINQYCTCIDDSRFTLRAANRQVNSGRILRQTARGHQIIQSSVSIQRWEKENSLLCYLKEFCLIYCGEIRMVSKYPLLQITGCEPLLRSELEVSRAPGAR